MPVIGRVGGNPFYSGRAFKLALRPPISISSRYRAKSFNRRTARPCAAGTDIGSKYCHRTGHIGPDDGNPGCLGRRYDRMVWVTWPIGLYPLFLLFPYPSSFRGGRSPRIKLFQHKFRHGHGRQKNRVCIKCHGVGCHRLGPHSI